MPGIWRPGGSANNRATAVWIQTRQHLCGHGRQHNTARERNTWGSQQTAQKLDERLGYDAFDSTLAIHRDGDDERD
jgi:hypothetical protein